MDTEKRLGIKKPKAIMLFVQMILIIFLLVISIYLFVFVDTNHLGPWMMTSYAFIILSVISLISYSIVGFKKSDLIFKLAVIPFALAVFVNILLPIRETFQVAVLAILFALVVVFIVKQENRKFTTIIGLSMIVVSLVFSIYSAIKANISFLGSVSDNWPTYVAMYSSIFIPVIMSVTFTLCYDVRTSRKPLK